MGTAQTRRSVKDDGVNLYTTPRWAVAALLKKEKFEGKIWEPCCGMGDISEELIAHGHEVLSTDLNEHGYGETGINFLDYTDDTVENIITNMPFDKTGLYMKMILHSMSMPNVKKIALFFSIQVLETVERGEFFEECKHFAKVYSFCDRVKCLTGGLEELSKGNNARHYCWIVFDKTKVYESATVGFLYKPAEMKGRKRKPTKPK